MLRRLGVPVLVAAQAVVVVVACLTRSTELTLPGSQPSPILLALLVVAASVAVAPVTLRLVAAERQAQRGGLDIRVVAVGTGLVLLASTALLVPLVGADVRLVLVWTGILWSSGVVAGRLVGPGWWLAVAAPGLVGFLMAGQVDDGGERWFLVMLQSPPAAVVAGLLMATATPVTLAPARSSR